MSALFTADDAARHRRAAKVARDILEVRKATELARAMGHVVDPNDDLPGAEHLDASVRDRLAWHTSMAERIDAYLGGGAGV